MRDTKQNFVADSLKKALDEEIDCKSVLKAAYEDFLEGNKIEEEFIIFYTSQSIP